MVHTGARSTDIFNVGFQPKQNIPESQKTEAWHKQNADYYIAMSPVWFRSKVNDYYDTYNGIRNPDKYKHLTATYGVTYPVDKIKNIPLIRPYISRLLSDYEERDLGFLVHSEDTESIQEKTREISEKLLDQITQIIMSGRDVEQELDLLQKYYQQEFKTETEIGAQHFLKHFIQKYRLERSFSEMLQDKFISGHEYYRVWLNRMGEDPKQKVIKPGTLFFADNDVKWVKECDWAVHNTEMTPTEILDAYGEKMKAEDIAKLEDWMTMYQKDSYYRLTSLDQVDAILNSNPSTWNRPNTSLNHKLGVYHVEWKSIRKQYIMNARNKYEASAPFIHPITFEELREIKTKSKKSSSYREKLRSVQVRYVQDLHSTIRIADNIYLDMGKEKYPIRSTSDPSKVYLTFNGPTFAGYIKPFSLIGETEDIQDLYNNLHFHKENLVALSGVKGMVMDVSQMPDFGIGGTDPEQQFAENIKRFMYYKKLGVAFIDSTKEGGNGNRFNQFSSYDDTLGTGMQVLLAFITHLEDVAARICGSSRQSLGDIKTYEGKGTTQAAINQSSLVTECSINEHDEVVEQFLTDLINAAKIAYKNGLSGHYITDQKTREIFTLSAGWANSDLGLYITNKSSDKRQIEELKAATMKFLNDSTMPFEDLLPLFKKDGLADIIRTIEGNMARRRIRMEQQQNQLQQVEAQLAIAKTEAEVNKLRAQVAEINNNLQIDQQKLLLEKQALEEDTLIDTEKLKLDQKRVDLEAKQLDVAASSKSNAAEVRNK